MNVTTLHKPDTGALGEPARASANVERHFARRGRGPEFDMEADWIRRRLPSRPIPWVDIGCGNGALIRAIGRNDAIGVDHSSLGLGPTAQSSPGTPFICADGAELPFADGSVAAITSQHVIEHLPDANRACREWFRVLERGGLLLLQTPNAAFRDPSVFEDPSHVQLFDRQSLAHIVREAGFSIVDLRTMGLSWFRVYQRIPAGWRFRRSVTAHAEGLSSLPGCRWSGQTLCCLAEKRVRS